jgi:predicted glycosyltransferase
MKCFCVCVYIHLFLQIHVKTSSRSIQMSVTTKKKYVVNEALQRYEIPDEKHYIVKVKIRINSIFIIICF